jgi:hypothetical protein
MQAVAATWLMTSLTGSPLLIAMVQSASSLPVVLLALPAGALADIADRRLILLISGEREVPAELCRDGSGNGIPAEAAYGSTQHNHDVSIQELAPPNRCSGALEEGWYAYSYSNFL